MVRICYRSMLVCIGTVFTHPTLAAEPVVVPPTVYSVVETGNYDRAEALAAAKDRALANIPDTFTAISLVTKSNEPSCVKLTIKGIQLWLVINRFPIPSVSVQVSIQVSHYNPDFIVSSYPRLGASPITEADIMYDSLQTNIAKSVFDLITGGDSSLIKRENQFGGHYAESGGSRRQMMYSEAEVIGHPGNLYSLAGLILSGNIDRVTQAPLEIATAIGETPVGMVEQIGDVGEGFADTDNSVPTLGDTSVWTDEVLLPLFFHEDIRRLIEAYNFGNDLLGAASNFVDIADDLNAVLDDPLGSITDAVLGSDEVESATEEIDESLGDIDGALDSVIDIVLDPELNTDDYEDLEEELESLGLSEEELDETMAGIENMDSVLEGKDVGRGGSLFSFCPSDATMYAPYYLPGVNVVGWRFGLPEMVYRNSYAMPTENTELFIGQFSDDDVDDVTDSEGNRPAWLDQVSLPQWSTWSSIYPRTGWVNNSDQLKARASAAFRAAHIVTRPDQAHVYLHPEKRTSGFKRVDTRGGLSPNDPETGSWQMVKPKFADECTLMQDSEIETGLFERRDEFVVDEQTNEATLTDGSLMSADGTYVWNLWRHYECAVKPYGDSVSELLYIPLGDGIPIFH